MIFSELDLNCWLEMKIKQEERKLKKTKKKCLERKREKTYVNFTNILKAVFLANFLFPKIQT
jgi:hypothetical protein